MKTRALLTGWMLLAPQGQVEVLQNGHRIQMLNRGTYFGEVAIMKEVVRSASCKAATNCEVSILRKKDLDEVGCPFLSLPITLQPQRLSASSSGAKTILGGLPARFLHQVSQQF